MRTSLWSDAGMVRATSAPMNGKLPPGPAAPSLVQTAQLFADPLGFIRRTHARYGDPFTVRLLGVGTIVVTAEPLAMKAIFTADPSELSGAEATKSVAPMLGDRSILLTDGAAHKRLRGLMLPPFHGERMRAYGATMSALAAEAAERLQPGAELSCYGEMMHVTLGVILSAVFGVHEPSRRAVFQKAVAALLGSWSPAIQWFAPLRYDLGPWSPGGRLIRARRALDALLFEEIARRRTGRGAGEDVLSLLFDARDEKGEPLSDEELRDQLLTLLLAGHETTACALSWAMVWLHHEPRTLARLRVELDTAGDDAQAITALPYLNAVCQEALRLIPVFPMLVRVAKKPYALRGATVPDGALVGACIYLAHRSPEVFPDAERFRPERFLERKFSPFEFMPFGAGARHCLGWAMALYELKLILAQLLRHREFELLGEKPTSIEPGEGNLRPVGGGRFRVAARRSQQFQGGVA
ncbi:MAG: cytochrome P450 [Myxococcaceae bacterium]